MVANAESLVATHQDELIRDAEQARLVRRCRAHNAEPDRPVRLRQPASDNDPLRRLMGRILGVVGWRRAVSR